MAIASPETNEPAQKKIVGLTPDQVLESRKLHGENLMTPPERDPWWRLFLEKFDDPVIRILIIAAVIAITVGIANGHYAEGIGIIVAILLATTLAFVNEYRAGREFAILNQVNDHEPVKVIRGGQHTLVPKSELVVGDAVVIETGDEIPADGHLLEAVSLQVDEARLTGESLPVNKSVQVPEHSESTYGVNALLRSTMVADGHGIFEVTSVGDNTEIGKTAREASSMEEGEETPLTTQLERLSKVIGVVGFAVAGLATFAALFVRGVLVGTLAPDSAQWFFIAVLMLGVSVALVRIWLPIYYDFLDLIGKGKDKPAWLEQDTLKGWVLVFAAGAVVIAVGVAAGAMTGFMSWEPRTWISSEVAEELLKFFMIAVTLIVVAVPEGLAMSVTLSLAYSMRKMTASNNLVRRMHACETIGAATVICSDKTGTLTLNKMSVVETHCPGIDTAQPNGGSQPQALLIEAITANTTANLDLTEPGEVGVIGNPTEGALLLWLQAAGISYEEKRAEFKIVAQRTFSTQRKWMGTLGISPVTGERVLHVKGAPEIVLEKCTHIGVAARGPMTAAHREELHTQLKALQNRAMRTIALAMRTVREDEGEQIDDLVNDLTWIGFVAIADPVRPEVPGAVAACREAGIDVKIITGDTVDTAREIGAQIGLLARDKQSGYMTGQDFEKLSDTEASEALPEMKILARARPLDKMRVVKLLQARGEVVAVTGDGTNDAPALHHAHVGLAMGKAGTAVAKEASDIILLDDSFKSIVNAVMWGRSLYENIQRFIQFQLTINVTALAIAFLGPFIGVELPLTVTQMLWVNLIMDTFAALALATEPPHWNVMKRKPRHPQDFIVSTPMAKSIFGIGGIFIVVLIALLFYVLRDGITPYELSYFFTFFVMLQFWNLFNARCLGRNTSAFSGLFENRAFLIIAIAIAAGQVLLVHFGGAIFRTVPLSLMDWVIIMASTSLVLWLGEAQRFYSRMKYGSTD